MKTITENIHGVGHIGTQHIVSVLTLLCIIQNLSYIRDAIVLKGTKTEKEIYKMYGLKYESICTLYKEIAPHMFNDCTCVVEKLACEFLGIFKNPIQTGTKQFIGNLLGTESKV